MWLILLEVIREDLLGEPPNREIEFCIDLLLDNQPISIFLYHMDLSELNEFKEKLKDLSKKGFIRPSLSLWGALVLFVHKKDDTLKIYLDYR